MISTSSVEQILYMYGNKIYVSHFHNLAPNSARPSLGPVLNEKLDMLTVHLAFNNVIQNGHRNPLKSRGTPSLNFWLSPIKSHTQASVNRVTIGFIDHWPLTNVCYLSIV